jgi:MFS transporter, FSR family, fosmidomycin resistance protein
MVAPKPTSAFQLALDGGLFENGRVRDGIFRRLQYTASMGGAAWLGAAHFAVDAACVTSVLRAAPSVQVASADALVFVLSYDVLAFAGQAPLGWLIDRFHFRRASALLGILLTMVALLAGSQFAIVALAGVGNALFHVGAGAMVLAGSKEKSAPAGVFVAPGALGLGLGIILGRQVLSFPCWPLLCALALALPIVVLAARPSPRAERATATSAVSRRKGYGQVLLVATLLSLSVAIRSLVGTVGCDACPRGLFLAIALPMTAFAGKCVGGFLADRFGWIDLSVTALLASAPLVGFGGGDFWLVLPGLLLFQMTMPVTLTAMFRLLPARPGFGFGLLCLALIAGALPAYLPGGWRPHGLSLFVLVLGSVLVLYAALKILSVPSRPQPEPTVGALPAPLA